MRQMQMFFLAALACLAARADLSDIIGAITNRVSESVQSFEDRFAVTDAELLAMTRAQYLRALATSNRSEIAKWHGAVSSTAIDTNTLAKTWTFSDGFTFTVKGSKRECNYGNLEKAVMNKKVDPRISQTKKLIADLKKLKAEGDKLGIALPAEAIDLKLKNAIALLDGLTNGVKVVTKTVTLGIK